MAPTPGGVPMTWNLVFFACAVNTFAAGFISVFMSIINPELAMFTFTSELFLMFFGLLMVILDAPIPQQTLHTWKYTMNARINIFKFLLFLTRFTGRGFCYLFLGSMIWAALFDHPTCQVLGAIMSIFSCAVGLGALIFGIILSHKLDKVRKQVQLQPGDIMQGCPPSGFSKVQFRLFCESKDSTVQFTDGDLDYVINGLSLNMQEMDGKVTKDEFGAWLSKGGMQLL